MLKQLNRKGKKKGFTLIELVIVLAVLAIIALIAIPNFTKVRNDSLKKADSRTGEQIEKITLMGIADEDIKVPSSSDTIDITFNATTGKAEATDVLLVGTDYVEMLKEVKGPQVNDKTGFQVRIDDEGNVDVFYNGGTTITE